MSLKRFSALSVAPQRRRWNYFCLNTSTPGKGLPSIHSRKAPPAVET
jgi:hypothetical protein